MAAKAKSLTDRQVKRPPCREDIKGRWRSLRNDLIDQLDESRFTAELVDQLVLNLIHADNARELAAAAPLVIGAAGQETEHPGYRVAARCESSARETAKSLGLFSTKGAKKDDEKEEKPATVQDELAALRTKKSA